MKLRRILLPLVCVLFLCACSVAQNDFEIEDVVETPMPVKQEKKAQTPEPKEGTATTQPEGTSEEVQWTLVCNTHESYEDSLAERPLRTHSDANGKEITKEALDAIIEALWSGESTLLWNWQSKKALQEMSNIRLWRMLESE